MRRQLVLACILSITSCICIAQGDDDFLFAPGIPSSIAVAAGGSATNRDARIDLDYGLASGRRLRAGLDVNRTSDGNDTYKSRSLRLGMGSDPGAPFSFNTDMEYWTQDGAANIASIIPGLTWALGNWQLTLTPEFRRISLATAQAAAARFARVPDNVKLFSAGVNAGVGYYGFTHWGLSLVYYRSDYSRDLTSLDLRPVVSQLLFRPAALNAAYSLNSARASAYVTYYFHRASLGGAFSRSVSAVDGSIYSVASASLGWNFGTAWNLSIDNGASYFNGSYDGYFATLAARYNW